MKVEWIGDMREIPKIGVFQAGDKIELPEDIAEGLTRQGLVKKAEAEKKTTKKGE